MATATKKRNTVDEDQVATLDDFQAISQEQEQAKRDALTFLGEQLPQLADGKSVSRAELQTALDLVGMTLEQLRQHAADYVTMQRLQAEVDQHDRMALGAELRRWQQEYDEFVRMHKERRVQRVGLLGVISANSVEAARLRSGLQAVGLIPRPVTPEQYNTVSGLESNDPREPLAAIDARRMRGK